MNQMLTKRLLYYLIELVLIQTLTKCWQKQKKKKDFINIQQTENIQDLNLEFLFLKVVILQKEKIITKKKYYPVVQVYQIIKEEYQDLNQTKEF